MKELKMDTNVLERLRHNNQNPVDWEKVKYGFKADITGHIDNEPIYNFFQTLTDNLEITANAISVSVQPIRSYIPFHVHNYVEIIVPLLGNCRFESRNGIIEIGQEDIMIVGRGTVHRVHEIDPTTIVVNIALQPSAFSFNDLNFMLHPGGGQSISNILFTILNDENYGDSQYNLFRIQHDKKIVSLIYDIIDEYYQNDIQANQIIHFNVLTLFSRLICHFYHTDYSVEQSKNYQNTLMPMLLYIEEHYADITLEKMADYFGFNPNYLSSYLKKNTGMTFIKLVHLQRVNVAAEYLQYTKAPIEQISVKVGYENPSYFYKMFRKILGVSPKEYRIENS